MTMTTTPPTASSTALARRDSAELFKFGLEPEGLDAALSLCERIAKTGMFSGDKGGEPASPGSLLVRLMTGRELGIPAMVALTHVYEVYGQPALSSRLKVALALRHPECERLEMTELTATSCTYTVKRTGKLEKPFTFTLDEAKKAGLVKTGSNWEKFLPRMLIARASGLAVDVEFPDAGMGLPSVEEAEDYGDRRGEMRGEVVPSQAAKRDWQAESDALKAALQQAATDGDVEAIKLTRARATLFAAEAPVELAKEVNALYDKLRREAQAAAKEAAAKAGAKAPGAAQAKPASAAPTGAASASAPAGPAPAGAPAASAPAGQAKPKDPDDGLFGRAAEYLPPNRRGDSYEGPDQPPPGWTP